nr:collagen alpha-1(I) chain-like [Dasypus novemcinctus]
MGAAFPTTEPQAPSLAAEPAPPGPSGSASALLCPARGPCLRPGRQWSRGSPGGRRAGRRRRLGTGAQSPPPGRVRATPGAARLPGGRCGGRRSRPGPGGAPRVPEGRGAAGLAPALGRPGSSTSPPPPPPPPPPPSPASAHTRRGKYALGASGRLRGQAGRGAPGRRRWLGSGAPVSKFPGRRATSGDARDGCARRPGLRRARRAATGERSGVQATATPSGRAPGPPPPRARRPAPQALGALRGAPGRRRSPPPGPRPAPGASRVRGPCPAILAAGRRRPLTRERRPQAGTRWDGAGAAGAARTAAGTAERVAGRGAGRPCASRECERAREAGGQAGRGLRVASGARGRAGRPAGAPSGLLVGPAAPARREPGPPERRPRPRAPAAPGQRPLSRGGSGGGGVGGGAREANRSSGAARRARGSPAQVRGEGDAGRAGLRAPERRAALALSAGLRRPAPRPRARLPVPRGHRGREPAPPRARPLRPRAPPPRPRPPAPPPSARDF